MKDRIDSRYLRKKIVNCLLNKEPVTLDFSDVFFIAEDYLKEVFFKISDNCEHLENIKIKNAKAVMKTSLKLAINNISRPKR